MTQPHHPNENLAEHHAGDLKTAVLKLLDLTGADQCYWCYAIEYMALVRSVLAKRSVDWSTPHDEEVGEDFRRGG